MNGVRTVRATVERLAPTGEGVVRTNEGVGLVEGALPGEEVDVEVLRVSRKIWRGRAIEIRNASPARASGGHADGCPACNWAHVELSQARAAKRDLFLETMSRIGRLAPGLFGSLPVAPSPVGYRLRSRFHAQTRSGRVFVGGFEPGSHRVLPLDSCAALGESMRSLLPRVAAALAAGPAPSEVATVESLDGGVRLARVTVAGGREEADRIARRLSPLFGGVRVVDEAGRLRHHSGQARLWLEINGRAVPAAPGAFFQANRFLIEALSRHVGDLAAAVPSGSALDAFGGSGLFAGALLDAGHRVVSVEGHGEAAESARLARDRWRAAAQWRIERASVLDFAAADPEREDVVVADPPRTGLGLPLTRALAARARRRFVYVSCDPATLARDLAVLIDEGWEIADAHLFDLFALTHRIEAVVALDRPRSA